MKKLTEIPDLLFKQIDYGLPKTSKKQKNK